MTARGAASPATPPDAADADSRFVWLWVGQAISLFGSQITFVALPLLAVGAFRASPDQMALLTMLQYAPYVALGIPIGAWVERRNKRRLLIAIDVMRAVLYALVPALALTGRLRMTHLYVIGAIGGCLTTCFEIASIAVLPLVVGRDELLDANARLRGSQAVAQVAGASAGGPLVQLLSAPGAMAIDALSYLVSAACLWRVRARETPSMHHAPSPGIGRAFRSMAGDSLLRVAVAYLTLMNLCAGMVTPLYVLFLSTVLHISSTGIGLVMAASAAGTVAGSWSAHRAAARAHFGRTVATGAVLAGLGGLLIPAGRSAAPGSLALALATQMLGGGVAAFGGAVASVDLLSLVQARAPSASRATIAGALRFATWGVVPLGAMLAAALADRVGARATIAVAMGGLLAAASCVVLTPLGSLRRVAARSAPEPNAPVPSVPGGAVTPDASARWRHSALE